MAFRRRRNERREVVRLISERFSGTIELEEILLTSIAPMGRVDQVLGTLSRAKLAPRRMRAGLGRKARWISIRDLDDEPQIRLLTSWNADSTDEDSRLISEQDEEEEEIVSV